MLSQHKRAPSALCVTLSNFVASSLRACVRKRDQCCAGSTATCITNGLNTAHWNIIAKQSNRLTNVLASSRSRRQDLAELSERSSVEETATARGHEHFQPLESMLAGA